MRDRARETDSHHDCIGFDEELGFEELGSGLGFEMGVGVEEEEEGEGEFVALAIGGGGGDSIGFSISKFSPPE